MSSGWRFLAGVMPALLIVGCSTDRQPSDLYGPDESGVLVVDALLIVDQPLPDLFIHETISPGETYTRDLAAVTDAVVEISALGMTHAYAADPDSVGRYLPLEAVVVRPETEYTLLVSSQGRTARDTTLTPRSFQLSESVILDEQTLEISRTLRTFQGGPEAPYEAPENQVTYLEGLLEVRFDPNGAAGYLVGIISLDEGSERVLEADFLDESDYDKLERHVSSPPFEALDGSVRLPWFAVYFAGRHLIRVHAIDTNWFDFARSSPENDDGGFGGLAGDSFERPLFSVTGGIGLFGSAGMDSLGIVILPRQEP